VFNYIKSKSPENKIIQIASKTAEDTGILRFSFCVEGIMPQQKNVQVSYIFSCFPVGVSCLKFTITLDTVSKYIV
jgi:hypothetical protein